MWCLTLVPVCVPLCVPEYMPVCAVCVIQLSNIFDYSLQGRARREVQLSGQIGIYIYIYFILYIYLDLITITLHNSLW